MLRNICILRLSALGDVVNCLPSLRAIQKTYPQAKISWIIGKTEFELLKDIPKVNWIVIDKFKIFKARKQIKKLEKFDVVLHMQASLRASFLKTALKAKRSICLDKERSKDCQHWFCGETIATRKNAHTLETYLDFAAKIGCDISKLSWGLDLAKIHDESKGLHLPKRFIAISPCSSKKIRNWTKSGYADVCDYIINKYQIPCVLIGGKSEIEFQYAQAIKSSVPEVINLIGKTSVRQMVAIIDRAEFLIAPDSGPAHIATAVATKVIGLYANTNPQRAAPYRSLPWLVNQYPVAVKTYLKGKHKFGARVNHPQVMNLITSNMVKAVADKLLS